MSPALILAANATPSPAAAGTGTTDFNGAIAAAIGLAIAALILVIILVTIVASWAGRRGNPGKTTNITVATLIPVIVLGGLAGAATTGAVLLVWGGDILRSFKLLG